VKNKSDFLYLFSINTEMEFGLRKIARASEKLGGNCGCRLEHLARESLIIDTLIRSQWILNKISDSVRGL
jgi:hypothetical protein